MNIRNFFKLKWQQLVCKHDYEITKWHWTHGINGCEPRYIEYICTCKKCGKKKYGEINARFEKEFIQKYSNKEG